MIRGEPAKHKIYSLSLQSIGMLHYIQDVRDHHIFFQECSNINVKWCKNLNCVPKSMNLDMDMKWLIHEFSFKRPLRSKVCAIFRRNFFVNYTD